MKTKPIKEALPPPARFNQFEVVHTPPYRKVRPKPVWALTVVTQRDGQSEEDFSVEFHTGDVAGCVSALRELADRLETECRPRAMSMRKMLRGMVR